jgi:hypothetical protein
MELTKFGIHLSKHMVIHYVLRATNILTVFGIRKNCHSCGRKLLFYLFMKMVIKLTVVIINGYQCYRLHEKFYSIFLSQV